MTVVYDPKLFHLGLVILDVVTVEVKQSNVVLNVFKVVLPIPHLLENYELVKVVVFENELSEMVLDGEVKHDIAEQHDLLEIDIILLRHYSDSIFVVSDLPDISDDEIEQHEIYEN